MRVLSTAIIIATMFGCSNNSRIEQVDAESLITMDYGSQDLGLALDGGPLDTGTEPDAETSPYLIHDVFENVPSPICTDLWDPVEDLTEEVRQWPAPSGTLFYVGDVTNDGRAEIFVRDFDLEDDLRQIGVTVWSIQNGAWHRLGQMRAFAPQWQADVDGDGHIDLGGWEKYVSLWKIDEEGNRYADAVFPAPSVRRGGEPIDGWLFDESLALFVEPEVPRAGGFKVNQTFPDASATRSLSTDLDGDGRPELFIYGHNVLMEFDGTEYGENILEPDDIFPISTAFGGGTTGDFDGDGHLELVHASYGPLTQEGNLRPVNVPHEHAKVVANRGDDTYETIARLAIGTRQVTMVRAGDMDGDGDDELLLGGSPGGCVRYQLWRTSDAGAFELIWQTDIVDSYGPIMGNKGVTKMTDFDQDGDDELVMLMDRVLTVWDWREDAASPHGGRMVQIYGERICDFCDWGQVWIGDLDGDGRDEFMVRNNLDRVDPNMRPDPLTNPSGVMIRSYGPSPIRVEP